MNILILGINGFIGHHLSRRILDTTDWRVYGMDRSADRVTEMLRDPRFFFFKGDIEANRDWVDYLVKECHVVLPLVAIATPALYVREPLSVFELDFEANLRVVRACVRHGKRVVFPSTSEVYGMNSDAAFHPFESNLVMGPVDKQRWIYACSKQLLDRVIWAYGQQRDLDFTLFRPFNWIGPGLDRLDAAREGSSRVVTQFLGHIARGEPIHLVDGGHQRRSFTWVEDGIAALMGVVENPGGVASGQIYNIGHPGNDISVRELAEAMLELAAEFPEYRPGVEQVELIEVSAHDYYGPGYQDIQTRVPWIDNTCADLDWAPQTDLRTALRRVLEAYRGEVAQARALLQQAS